MEALLSPLYTLNFSSSPMEIGVERFSLFLTPPPVSPSLFFDQKMAAPFCPFGRRMRSFFDIAIKIPPTLENELPQQVLLRRFFFFGPLLLDSLNCPRPGERSRIFTPTFFENCENSFPHGRWHSSDARRCVPPPPPKVQGTTPGAMGSPAF